MTLQDLTSADTLTLRVAARFMRAEQQPGMRKNVQELVSPINKPRGIDRGIVRDHGQLMEEGIDDTVKPNRRDIRPEDAFAGTPNQMGVLNLAETGKDLSKVLRTQIQKDKGYDVVRNLSQYLIRTEGGGGADPVE
jgi:hypothetical protein